MVALFFKHYDNLFNLSQVCQLSIALWLLRVMIMWQ